FVDLLNVIHPDYTPLKDSCVSHILKLAVHFQMKGVVEQCENYLRQSSKFNVVKKLIVAEEYHLQNLKNHAFESMNCVKIISNLSTYPDHKLLSDALKLEIYDKFMVVGRGCDCHTHNI
ncbi:hypothetical protein PMAYCL1PPCAC_25483, partial [Pristionchus mayeri]